MESFWRLDKYLPAVEDWYPSFQCVRCSIMPLSTGQTRVCVWGADDTGMERDFDTPEAAKAVYEEIPSPVTREWLEEKGFVRA